MKRLLAPLLLLALAVGGALWLQQRQHQYRTRFPAPEFALPDLRGSVHRLSDFRGKVVLLNIWITSCPPCREEMPSMEVLSRRMAEKDFVVLGVSQDEEGRAAVQPFVDQFGITFPVLLDPRGEVGRKFGVTGYPETFIIDKDGTVLEHHIGFRDWSDERVGATLRQLIAAPGDGRAPAA